MNCAEARHLLGVYVLGALEPAERAAVDRHIAQCASCRDEVAMFAGLPGLLGRLDLNDVEALDAARETGLQPDSVGPDPGLLDRALAQVRAERRRTHRLRLAVAASAVAAMAVAGGVYAGVSGSGSGSSGTSTAATTVSATDPVTHVWAAAALTPKAWGTQISLQLSGVPIDEHCRLVARAKDGHQEVAGSWEVGYRGTASITSAVSIPKGSLTELDVVTFAGQRLVRIPLAG